MARAGDRAASAPEAAKLPAAAALVIGALMLLGSRAYAESAKPSPYRKLEVFTRALVHVEQSHVLPIDEDALIEGAIRGMLAALDPHSEFLTAEEVEVLAADVQGRYAGIGVEIDVRDGWLVVTRVMQGGPAASAGLQVGDRFLSIDGKGARDLPIGEAVRRMRGAPGTRVAVRLRRDGVEEGIAVELTREIIDVPAVEARLLPDRVAYVRLRSFQETTADELEEALDAAAERSAAAGGLRGLLLDLRDNPGGLVGAAVAVADQLLDDGVIVTTRGRGGRLLREFRARRAGTRPNWPVVVLINGFSASAAEIVAGALQDQRRAVLVGTRSFGKGSVQNIIDLPDGSALKLSTALYYTPSGRSIQAAGIEPDVRVERARSPTTKPQRAGEATLAGHLPAEGGAAASSQPDAFDDDEQARIAHHVLRALLVQSRSR
jgi:carboxyl-terminal processing protease